MTGQFIVGTLLFALAVGSTANLWLLALHRLEFQKIAKFYKRNFLGFAASLVLLLAVSAAIGPNIGNALLQGVSAAFVLFLLFAWGRLTVIGLKFDLTHRALPTS